MSIPILHLKGERESVFDDSQWPKLEALLPAWLCGRRWFGGKAHTQRGVTIVDVIPMRGGAGTAALMLIRVEYLDAAAEIYSLPVTFATGREAARLESESPTLILARTDGANEGQRGVLHDATGSADFANVLFEAIIRGRSFGDGESRIECTPTPVLRELGVRPDTALAPSLSTAEQSNTSIRFGDKLLLKLFRRPANGINPDLEIGRVLTARRFRNSPPLAGAIECRAKNGVRRTLGVLHGFVPNALDGWQYMLGTLGHYFDRVRSFRDANPVGEPVPPRLDGTVQTLDAGVGLLLGDCLESVRVLGQRTAEMHLALAAECDHPDFVPEPFTPDIQRGLCQTMSDLTRQNLLLLRAKLGTFRGEQYEAAAAVVVAEASIIGRFQPLANTPLTGRRIRVHGDYHLGQTLWTGRDFFIVDFEGEPAAPLSERRMKQTPFSDMAGLLRSFDYAANAALRRKIEQGTISAADLPRFTAWASRWTCWISAACIESYLSHLGTSDILPASIAGRALLLDTHLLRKAIYEVGYELNNRPDWLPIPCRGIISLLSLQDHRQCGRPR